MNYTQKNSWVSVNMGDDSEVIEERHVPSQSMIRTMNLATGAEPAFTCPACGGRFKLTYGRFGHQPEVFPHNDGFWCVDCAELNNIVRVK